MSSSPTPAPQADDDAFVAALLRQRLADQRDGVVSSLADQERRFPGREALVRRVWRETENGSEAPDETAVASIGPYRLLRRLGHGGQGDVWLAEDPRLGRRVAIKMLRGIAFASADGLARFRREAEASSRLDHPGICTVYDAGFDAGVPYLVMRYLDGEPLAGAIAALVPHAGPQRDQQSRRVATIVERLARALHTAHKAGVLHRDLKPQNVMLMPDDAPVLLDFGLARLVDDDSLFTRTGERCGTPAYQAPEQLAPEPAPHGRAGDIYALGIVLYECLTGRRPFEAPTLDGLYRRILDGSPTRADARNRAVPRDLAVIAATAIDRQPARRYATAAAFADDLRRWLDHQPILARAAGPLLRLQRWWQRSPAFAGALLGLFATLAIGLVLSLSLWQEAAAEERRATTLLGEWERLADRRRLDELLAEADQQLWPAVPEKLAAMDDWLARAELLLTRQHDHEQALAHLRDGNGDREGTLEFAWRCQQLEDLVHQLAAFAADDAFATTVTSVRRRREWAAGLSHLTLEQPAAAWAAAIARIRQDARYGHLELRPQPGLVPLGRDAQSGLEEFADPRCGDVPPRDAAGQLVRTEATTVVFVLLPAAEYRLGAQRDDANAANFDPAASYAETPPQLLRLDAFLLSKYELTQQQWHHVMGDVAGAWQAGRVVRGVTIDGRHPVANVTWLHCETVCRHCGWVLPTEAQWEYACRAGTDTPWATGGDERSLLAAANFADEASRDEYPVDWTCHPGTDDGHAVPAPIGSYPPNGFGLCDMHGNVREWCLDVVLRYDNPVLPGTGERVALPDREPRHGEVLGSRVHRGGSCAAMAVEHRSAHRGSDQVGTSRPSLGMRPARLLLR